MSIGFFGCDEVEVYVYQCEICEFMVKSRTIHQCLVCYKLLCTNPGCNMGDICINHYNMLSDEGKEAIKQITLNEKHDLKLYKHLLYGFIGFISLLYVFYVIIFFILARNGGIEFSYALEPLSYIIFPFAGAFALGSTIFIIYLLAVSHKVKKNENKRLKIVSKFSKLN